MKSIFSQNLIKARKVKHWSQEKTSQKLGIKQKRYAKYEEGRSCPKPELIKIIMEHFGINEQDMYPFIFNENFFDKK